MTAGLTQRRMQSCAHMGHLPPVLPGVPLRKTDRPCNRKDFWLISQSDSPYG